MNNILLFAHPKTAQHYILFFLANYRRLLNGINEPIGWEKVMETGKLGKEGIDKLAQDRTYNEEIPNFVRIEYPYSYSLTVNKFIDSFDKKVYLYRNPYDVMISMYYYFVANPEYIRQINSAIDFKGNQYFEDFCKAHLDGYISHVETSIDKADLVLYYDSLKQDPTDFMNLLLFFYDNINGSIFQKVLEWSSFNFVNKMEKELKKGQENVVFHARSGRSGQYKELMSTSLIDYITDKWNGLKERVEYEIK